ncbi:MAG: AraC family transcriptional regulator [Neomegalonema sp.]|nr:AraC family transcriptional regulator [Neomegalonema sp.]
MTSSTAPTPANTEAQYYARMDRVRAYIEAELARGGQALDLDALAEVACLSRFHFHRIYRAITGETPAQTVRRARLHRAAASLLESDRPVAEIAIEAGYGGVEAFTRAFAAAYQAGPASYRAAVQKERIEVEHIIIREEPSYRLAALAHRGSYQKIGEAFERLGLWAQSAGMWRPETVTLGVYYDDPGSTPEAELRSDACVTVPEGVTPTAPARLLELTGGPAAVYRHVGPYAELGLAWEQFYGGWLPTSSREPADKPPYELYLNSPATTPPADLITEICIPLKSA